MKLRDLALAVLLFDPVEWRRGPLPLAADGRYRPPRPGDFLKPDEASVRAAHRHCLARLKQFEQDGYRHRVLPVSMTSMWRYDKDPPFAPLVDFVAAWNRLGLQPRLRLANVTEAMRELEVVAGPTASELTGEWTDWWANGTASAPREIAASRAAVAHLGAHAGRGAAHRGRADQGPVSVRRTYLGFQHERGTALQSRHTGSVERKGAVRLAADGAGGVAAFATRAHTFGARRGRSLAGQPHPHALHGLGQAHQFVPARRLRGRGRPRKWGGITTRILSGRATLGTASWPGGFQPRGSLPVVPRPVAQP